MTNFVFEFETGTWPPYKNKLSWKGSFWDVIEKAGRPYLEVELAKRHFRRIAITYEALTADQRIDGERAARYLACMHRDELSLLILAIVEEIEGRFEQSGTISGQDLGILRRCYWQGNNWKDDWKFPEEPYLAKGERPGQANYGKSEQSRMTNQATERTQSYLTNMRRAALKDEARSSVQQIEDQFLRDGFLTKEQVVCLYGCSLYSNGQGSLPDLNSWKANFQAVQG